VPERRRAWGVFRYDKRQEVAVKYASFRPILGATAAVVLITSGAMAQTTAPKSGAPDQNAPEHFDDQATKPDAQNKSLSQRLDETNGVIKPPAHVDPEIHETPPPTGDQNVIHPPVNPTVKPK
jgi:hypothetical protein